MGVRRVIERIVLLDTGRPASASAWNITPLAQMGKTSLPSAAELVLTEAAFLLKREGRDTDALFSLLERGVIRIALAVEEQQADLRVLTRRHRAADLISRCVSRLALEIPGAAEVLTLDGDFRIYLRRHGNKVIPVRMPN